MKRYLLTCVVVGAGLLTSVPALAQVPEDVRASIALFYDALSAAPGKDVAHLVARATVPQWVSCGANDACRARDEVATAITARHKAIPDLKWEIKEVLLSDNRVVVRGEASGHPIGDFMGVPHAGKPFKIMSIDVHTIEGGKFVRSYHIEDWMGAVRQLSGK